MPHLFMLKYHDVMLVDIIFDHNRMYTIHTFIEVLIRLSKMFCKHTNGYRDLYKDFSRDFQLVSVYYALHVNTFQ